ncbi:hypothetical protein SAMD00019534_051350, partial [Acytostelium subglobosum LB1]|uniref:hypothetical protein n=1 Tax=Acytostelium subglobosum LB1 TaxID=1410327 RepID=UPI000644833F
MKLILITIIIVLFNYLAVSNAGIAPVITKVTTKPYSGWVWSEFNHFDIEGTFNMTGNYKAQVNENTCILAWTDVDKMICYTPAGFANNSLITLYLEDDITQVTFNFTYVQYYEDDEKIESLMIDDPSRHQLTIYGSYNNRSYTVMIDGAVTETIMMTPSAIVVNLTSEVSVGPHLVTLKIQNRTLIQENMLITRSSPYITKVWDDENGYMATYIEGKFSVEYPMDPVRVIACGHSYFVLPLNESMIQLTLITSTEVAPTKCAVSVDSSNIYYYNHTYSYVWASQPYDNDSMADDEDGDHLLPVLPWYIYFAIVLVALFVMVAITIGICLLCKRSLKKKQQDSHEFKQWK